MAFENSAGIGVSTHYGARTTGTTIGVEHTSDSYNQLSVYFTPETLNDEVPQVYVIPAGAHFLRGTLTVEEAVVGASEVLVGEAGEEDTNGVDITTLFGSVGTKVLATGDTAGEWSFTSATGLTTNQTVGISVSGTATAGRGSLVLEYVLKKRDGSPA